MRRTFLLLLLVATVALPRMAAAQAVQRCLGADGRTVFTDRRCEEVGAVQRVPTPATVAGNTRRIGQVCPRRLSELVAEIGAAIQSGDVNRLSALYDWRGVSSATAAQRFDQLEAIVARPLLDIAPVYRETGPLPMPDASGPASAAPRQALPGPTPTGPAAWMPSWRQTPAAQADADTAEATTSGGSTAVAAPSPPRPVALRIEQTLGRSATPVRTVLGLHRVYDCFWISL